jgi:thioredoxin 1
MKEVSSLNEFDAAVNGNQLVVVDFFAPWCMPCSRIAPRLEELEKLYSEIYFVKVNVDDAFEITTKCGVTAMPTFHFYKNGILVKQFKGADRAALDASVEELCTPVAVTEPLPASVEIF